MRSSFINLIDDESEWEKDPAVQNIIQQSVNVEYQVYVQAYFYDTVIINNNNGRGCCFVVVCAYIQHRQLDIADVFRQHTSREDSSPYLYLKVV